MTLRWSDWYHFCIRFQWKIWAPENSFLSHPYYRTSILPLSGCKKAWLYTHDCMKIRGACVCVHNVIYKWGRLTHKTLWICNSNKIVKPTWFLSCNLWCHAVMIATEYPGVSWDILKYAIGSQWYHVVVTATEMWQNVLGLSQVSWDILRYVFGSQWYHVVMLPQNILEYPDISWGTYLGVNDIMWSWLPQNILELSQVSWDILRYVFGSQWCHVVMVATRISWNILRYLGVSNVMWLMVATEYPGIVWSILRYPEVLGSHEVMSCDHGCHRISHN